MASRYFIERKAIDVSDRLGSLYDASTDSLIDRYSVQGSDIQSSQKASVCRVFSSVQSNDLIDYFKCMDFDDALQQSILFGMIKTSGVSSLMNYNQPIIENIRFLYYSYRSKEEELVFTPGKGDRIVPVPSVETIATHIITGIEWGFEFLCIIPIPDEQSSDTVDGLLRSISIRLKNSDEDFVPIDSEKHHITQLVNTTAYGSETCIESLNMPLLTILNRIQHWKKHTNFHHPLKYIMQSLRWFYNNKQFPDLSDLSHVDNIDIATMKPIITFLDRFEKYFQRVFKIHPESFSSPTLSQVLKDIEQHLQNWMITHQDFRENLQKLLVDVRRRRCKSAVIPNLISNEQYSIIKKAEIESFYKKCEQLLKKTLLIEQLNEDNIYYVNVLDLRHYDKIPVTDERIEKAVRQLCRSETSFIFILYSNDRLKEEDPNAWKQSYKKLMSVRQQTTQETTLVYVDFTECQCDLEHLTIVTLPMNPSSQIPRNDPRGMKSS